MIAWADLTTFTIQFSIYNFDINYLFTSLPHTHTHTHTRVPSVPELDKSKAYATPLEDGSVFHQF